MERNHCYCCCRCWDEEGAEREVCRSSELNMLRRKETRVRQFLTLLMFSLTACLLLLLLLFLCRHQASHPYPQQVTFTTCTIVAFCKLRDFVANAPFDNITDGKYLQWEHSLGNAKCLGGFRYSSGNLVVPRSGIYRVFLQITYESKSRCNKELKLTQIVFSFYNSYNENMRLLSSVDTVNCSLDHWRKSLYTAGIFYLEGNTLLRVMSSNPELIARKEDLVFFGAEFLSE
uniref:THD domain-containing protein n=1 Tax=Cynoglossus semilaevis TaxID=244447 RepID=A0A3P8VQJ7_CYNSE